MVHVVGGGLSGSECALKLASFGMDVVLYEMRPGKLTGAHRTGLFAELVCSNSFKSMEITNAHGLLKKEMEMLGSFILKAAYETQVPAGKALAVDRERFSSLITRWIEENEKIRVVREEVKSLDFPGIKVIATGPLTSDGLSEELRKLFGDCLYFYDAISPIVSFESIDMSRAFFGARYGVDDSYINCPLTEEEFERFYQELIKAEEFVPHLEEDRFFEGCLPVEEIARRGKESLLFSVMKPVGLVDPKTGEMPYAVVQLRRENKEGTMWNLVGFQTRLRRKEQERVFRLIPCLRRAEFLRYGSMHRNTYINSPRVLLPTLRAKKRDDVYVVGQLCGVEGYMESTAMGLLCAVNIKRRLEGKGEVLPPEGTMLRGLIDYITEPKEDFQPMNANFGLLPPVKGRKKEKRRQLAERSISLMEEWVKNL